jgi:hypothetical protein
VARVWIACLSMMIMGIIGCGAAEYRKDVVPVSGTVTCGGRPVTEGYVYFVPKVPAGADAMKSGKAASGYINADGTYTLTTYDEGDGALVGEHEVHIERLAPEDDESDEGIAYDRDPNLCGRAILQVTVTDGDNVIDLDPAKG